MITTFSVESKTVTQKMTTWMNEVTNDDGFSKEHVANIARIVFGHTMS